MSLTCGPQVSDSIDLTDEGVPRVTSVCDQGDSMDLATGAPTPLAGHEFAALIRSDSKVCPYTIVGILNQDWFHLETGKFCSAGWVAVVLAVWPGVDSYSSNLRFAPSRSGRERTTRG